MKARCIGLAQVRSGCLNCLQLALPALPKTFEHYIIWLRTRSSVPFRPMNGVSLLSSDILTSLLI